jgi:hypothetical protein
MPSVDGFSPFRKRAEYRVGDNRIRGVCTFHDQRQIIDHSIDDLKSRHGYLPRLLRSEPIQPL